MLLSLWTGIATPRFLYPRFLIIGVGRRWGHHQGSRYKPVIGLEVHAQLKTKTKLFSPASTTPSMPNQHVHIIDLALPGTLPVSFRLFWNDYKTE